MRFDFNKKKLNKTSQSLNLTFELNFNIKYFRRLRMEAEKVTVESTKTTRADYTECGRADVETPLGRDWPEGKQQQST